MFNSIYVNLCKKAIRAFESNGQYNDAHEKTERTLALHQLTYLLGVSVIVIEKKH